MSTTQSTTPPAPSTGAQASLYQQLRAHLATLKLADAAEHLPAVLDEATAEHLSVTATLERLLAIEVNATAARRLAGRLRFACLPTPATLEDFDYDAASGVDPHLIADLATGHYLESATNVLRPAGSRKDSPGRGVGPQGRRVRVPHLRHYRRGPGRPLPPRRDRGTLGHHHAVLRRTHAPGHRRAWLPAVAGRGRLSAVPGDSPAVHQNLDDRDDQPAHHFLG